MFFDKGTTELLCIVYKQARPQGGLGLAKGAFAPPPP